MLLDNDGLCLSMLKTCIHHRATLLAQQYWTMLASFERAFTKSCYTEELLYDTQ
jgi:hypothetical protein